MSEMIKRRKDQGFTLIELMIVIAVIGILAIVLVPKVGTIKTQSKSAGIDTNVRMVQGYIQSRISSWNNSSTAPTVASVGDDVYDAFSVAKNPNIQDQITNPFDTTKKGSAKGAVTVPATAANAALYVQNVAAGTPTPAANLKGTIVVVPVISGGAITSVVVYAHDSTGAEISDKTVTITP